MSAPSLFKAIAAEHPNVATVEDDHLVLLMVLSDEERGAIDAGLVVNQPCTSADLPLGLSSIVHRLPQDADYYQEMTVAGRPTGRFFVWPKIGLEPQR